MAKTTQKDGGMVPYNYGADANRGWENTDSSDFAIPFLGQLQALSPEITNDVGDGGIEGARVGMFVNSVTKQLLEEVILVPCVTQHNFVEWVPRDAGGGFVGLHGTRSPVVEAAKKASSGDIRNLRTSEGNELVDTYTIFALRLDAVESERAAEMVVLSFTKTKIKRYREIMTRVRTMAGSLEIPLFAHRLRMIATSDKNPAGQSYKNVRLEPAVNNDPTLSLLPPDSAIMKQARSLLESVSTGQARAGYETEGKAGGKAKDEVF